MTDFKLRSQKVVAAFATSFLSEGYIIVTKMESVALMFYKLHHSSNGNTIIIKAVPSQNRLIMEKNGVKKIDTTILDGHGETVHKS